MSVKSLFVIIAIVVIHIVESIAFKSYDEDRPCICTREYIPVCASNGATYPNQCFYKCQKQKNKNLYIKFFGDCDEPY